MIFFAKHYVARLEYETDVPMEKAQADYRKIIRNAYKLIQGTWGYSHLELEQTKTSGDQNQGQIAAVAGFNGMNQMQILQSIFDDGTKFIPRGYFCFKDEMDALQFRLSVETRAIQVYMWPEKWFTIHEVVETDEQ